jgi:AAHS family 4-hydroxybenzoate transporter-like MFS transporter
MRRIDPALPADARFVLDDTSDARMSVAALFRNGRARRTVLLWLMVFCSLLDLYLLSNWLPTQIASLGISVTMAILISIMLQVGGFSGMFLGLIIDKVGPARVLAFCYVVAAVAIAGIALAGDAVLLLVVFIGAAGFGVIGGQIAANSVAAATYPTEIRSTGVGWFLGIGRIGSIVGPALAGFMLSVGVSNRDVFLMAVIPALVAACAAAALGKPRAAGPRMAEKAPA